MHSSLFELSEAAEVDLEEPGEDRDAVGLPDGNDAPAADDEVIEGLDDPVDEAVVDEVAAETDPGPDEVPFAAGMGG